MKNDFYKILSSKKRFFMKFHKIMKILSLKNLLATRALEKAHFPKCPTHNPGEKYRRCRKKPAIPKSIISKKSKKRHDFQKNENNFQKNENPIFKKMKITKIDEKSIFRTQTKV